MSALPSQYDLVRIVGLRDNRFEDAEVYHDRHPQVGDIGAVVEIYTNPNLGYEVECVDDATGFTIWLNAMYPEEIELVQRASLDHP